MTDTSPETVLMTELNSFESKPARAKALMRLTNDFVRQYSSMGPTTWAYLKRLTRDVTLPLTRAQRKSLQQMLDGLREYKGDKEDDRE